MKPAAKHGAKSYVKHTVSQRVVCVLFVPRSAVNNRLKSSRPHGTLYSTSGKPTAGGDWTGNSHAQTRSGYTGYESSTNG